MLVIGLILGIVYSRLVQDYVYAYISKLETLPSFLVELEKLVQLEPGSMMQVYKSTVAIVMLGVVPAIIVILCMCVQFYVESALDRRRHRRMKKVANV